MGAEVAIGYRAVLRLGREQNAVTAAEEQVRAWLRSKAKRARLRKGPAEWDGPGFHAVGRGSDLLVVHADHDEDTPRRLYRLTEVMPRVDGSFLSMRAFSQKGNDEIRSS